MHPGLPYQHVLEKFGEAFNVDGLADTPITWEAKGKILEAVVDRAKWCVGLQIQHQDTQRYQQLVEGVRDIISTNTTDRRYTSHPSWALDIAKAFLDRLCSILDKTAPPPRRIVHYNDNDNAVHGNPSGNTSSTKRRITEVSTGLAQVEKGKGKGLATSSLEAQRRLNIAPVIGPVVVGGDLSFHSEQAKGAVSGSLSQCTPNHLTQQLLNNIRKAQQTSLSPAQRVQLNLCISQASHFIRGPKIPLIRPSPRFHTNPDSKAQSAGEKLVKGCQNIMSQAVSCYSQPSLATVNQLVANGPSPPISGTASSTFGIPPTKKIKPNGAMNSMNTEVGLAPYNIGTQLASSVYQKMLPPGAKQSLNPLQQNSRGINLASDNGQGEHQDKNCNNVHSNLAVTGELLPQYNPTGLKDCNTARANALTMRFDTQIPNTYIHPASLRESSHPEYPTPQAFSGDGMVNEQSQSNQDQYRVSSSENPTYSGMLPPPVPFITPDPSQSPQSPLSVFTNSGRSSSSDEAVVARNLQLSTVSPAAMLPVYHTPPTPTPQTGAVYVHQQLHPYGGSTVPIYTSSHSSPSPNPNSGIDFGASEDLSDMNNLLGGDFYQDLLGESWFPESSLGDHQEEQYEPSMQTLVYQSENLQNQSDT